jgi:GT2 family glycosyltransferase
MAGLPSGRPDQSDRSGSTTAPASRVTSAAPTAPAVPAVVVVMVAHEPGPWWEDALISVAQQSYANVSVFVVDTASEGGGQGAPDVARRLAAVLPDAYLRRLDRNAGYGPALNEALGAIEGASFLLLCHDDVVFDPDAIQALVREAYRSNAGIVGPKIVDWADPQRLLQVGMAIDKFGVPSPLAERGELDQQQHDAVNDVFYVPGAAMLVRADLFATLGGFDPGIDLIGDDLDFCWRAHLAGARVLVAPGATVAHREAFGERSDRTAGRDHSAGGSRRPADARRLALRHRLRTTLVCYGRRRRWSVVSQALVLAVASVLGSLVLGRLHRAADVMSAWVSNVCSLGEIRRRRKALRAVRTVHDRDIKSLQVRGSTGVSTVLRRRFDTGPDTDRDPGAAADDRTSTTRPSTDRGPTSQSVLTTWAAVLVLLAIGSRDLITAPIPAIGEFVAFPASPMDLLRAWTSDTGAPAAAGGSTPYSPTAFALLAALGLVLLGNMDLLQRVLVVSLLPVGVLGVWRLTGPIGSRLARMVGIVTYAAMPLATNSIAGGRWSGLVLYAAVPWWLNQLARASRQAPYGAPGDGAGARAGRGWHVATDRSVLHHVVVLGVITALTAMVVPYAVFIVVGMAVAVAVGGLIAGQAGGGARLLVTAVGAAAVAFTLQLPWSLEWFSPGWWFAAGAAPPAPLPLDRIVRFAVGDSSLWSWAFLAGAGLALLIGRDWRLGWAVRGWLVAVAGWVAVWIGSHGWLGAYFPPVEVVLPTGAGGLALASALGVAAVESDLAAYHFGWRQPVAVLAGAALTMAVITALPSAVDGRWHLPAGDFNPMLANLDSPTESFHTLWIGEPTVMPGKGWALDSWSSTDRAHGLPLRYETAAGRTPTAANLWPGSDAGTPRDLDHAIGLAMSDQTDRLGAMLATVDIEYVIAPQRRSPPPYSSDNESTPTGLLEMLAGQLDLARVDLPPGITVYRNLAWQPAVPATVGPRPSESRPTGRYAWLMAQAALWLLALAYLWRDRVTRERAKDRLRGRAPEPRPE